MSIKKFFSPAHYLFAIRFRYRRWKRNYSLQQFVKGGFSEADKASAYLLALSMEYPFGERPKLVLDYFEEVGSSEVNLRHEYFSNMEITFDLADNFQMAICQEFFTDHVYNLNKLKFEPEVVIDCGGYKGYFTLLAVARFKNAQFSCIEALQNNYNDIVKTFERNHLLKVAILNAAVSKSKEPVEFFIEGSNGSMENSFSNESYKVLVPTVDLYDLINGKDKLLLKVDIEGSELDFFPEIINSLPASCAVFLETHDGWNSLKSIKEVFIANHFSFELIREREQFIDVFAQRVENISSKESDTFQNSKG